MDSKTNTFLSQFAGLAVPQTATAVRERAAEELKGMSLPTTRWEAWKYTSVRPLLAHSFQQAKGTTVNDITPYLIPELDANIMVFVNGKYDGSLSQIEPQSGLTIRSLDAVTDSDLAAHEKYFGQVANSTEDIFATLNTAFAADGVWVHVSKNKTIDKALHIIHLTDVKEAVAVQSRNLFVVENFAEVKVVESFHSLSDQATFRNGVTEWVVGENASCEYAKLQLENQEALGVDRTEIHQAKDSQVQMFTITLGGAWTRNNLHFHLKGQNTTSILNGLSMLDGEQHVDNHTLVDHFEPNCYSDELYKGILDGNASSAFRGKIHVHPDAQKTNAYQSNRNILLSNTASINTKPQLEIYADDVKCSHGATTGQIDEDALFYLQARGIPLQQAKKLMVYAFAGETIEKMKLEPVADYISKLIEDRF